MEYAKLTRALTEVKQTTNGKKNMNAEETPPHFKFKFHELLQIGSKGSQTYRIVLKNYKPEIPLYNTELWEKKLKTKNMCQGEIRNTYK